MPPKPWSLDTKGVFVIIDENIDPNSEGHIPEIVKVNGWVETLDVNSIEDVIDNAKAQLIVPSLDDLFEAFVFYIDNDAFIQFKASQ